MNRQSLIAVFAVCILISTACTISVTNTSEVDATADIAYSQTPEFTFDGYTKVSMDHIDTYYMETMVSAHLLFGDAAPEFCNGPVTVRVVISVDNDDRAVGIDILAIADGKSILSFKDRISEIGINEWNIWAYEDLIPPDPEIKVHGFFEDIKTSATLISELQGMLSKGKIVSKTLIDKIKTTLSKAAIKKIVTTAATAVIPGIGWAFTLVKIGLMAYELAKMRGELEELVELVRIDIDGYVFYESTMTLRLAQRYCGSDGNVYTLEHIVNMDYLEKTRGTYHVAFIFNNTVFVSEESISRDYAIAIISIEEDTELNTYALVPDNARQIAKVASGGLVPKGPDGLHDGLFVGMDHYHHALHVDRTYSKDGKTHYPAHSFFGTAIFSES